MLFPWGMMEYAVVKSFANREFGSFLKVRLLVSKRAPPLFIITVALYLFQKLQVIVCLIYPYAVIVGNIFHAFIIPSFCDVWIYVFPCLFFFFHFSAFLFHFSSIFDLFLSVSSSCLCISLSIISCISLSNILSISLINHTEFKHLLRNFTNILNSFFSCFIYRFLY